MRHYAELGGSATAGPTQPETLPEAFPQTLQPPPQLPAAAQPQSYRRQETDYAGLFDSDDSTTA